MPTTTQQAWVVRESHEGRTPVLPFCPLCPVCLKQEAEHNSKERAFCDEAHRWPLNCPHCGTGFHGRHTGFCSLSDENEGA